MRQRITAAPGFSPLHTRTGAVGGISTYGRPPSPPFTAEQSVEQLQPAIMDHSEGFSRKGRGPSGPLFSGVPGKGSTLVMLKTELENHLRLLVRSTPSQIERGNTVPLDQHSPSGTLLFIMGRLEQDSPAFQVAHTVIDRLMEQAKLEEARFETLWSNLVYDVQLTKGAVAMPSSEEITAQEEPYGAPKAEQTPAAQKPAEPVRPKVRLPVSEAAKELLKGFASTNTLMNLLSSVFTSARAQLGDPVENFKPSEHGALMSLIMLQAAVRQSEAYHSGASHLPSQIMRRMYEVLKQVERRHAEPTRNFLLSYANEQGATNIDAPQAFKGATPNERACDMLQRAVNFLQLRIQAETPVTSTPEPARKLPYSANRPAATRANAVEPTEDEEEYGTAPLNALALQHSSAGRPQQARQPMSEKICNRCGKQAHIASNCDNYNREEVEAYQAKRAAQYGAPRAAALEVDQDLQSAAVEVPSAAPWDLEAAAVGTRGAGKAAPAAAAPPLTTSTPSPKTLTSTAPSRRNAAVMPASFRTTAVQPGLSPAATVLDLARTPLSAATKQHELDSAIASLDAVKQLVTQVTTSLRVLAADLPPTAPGGTEAAVESVDVMDQLQLHRDSAVLIVNINGEDRQLSTDVPLILDTGNQLAMFSQSGSMRLVDQEGNLVSNDLLLPALLTATTPISIRGAVGSTRTTRDCGLRLQLGLRDISKGSDILKTIDLVLPLNRLDTEPEAGNTTDLKQVLRGAKILVGGPALKAAGITINYEEDIVTFPYYNGDGKRRVAELAVLPSSWRVGPRSFLADGAELDQVEVCATEVDTDAVFCRQGLRRDLKPDLLGQPCCAGGWKWLGPHEGGYDYESWQTGANSVLGGLAGGAPAPPK